MRSGHMGRSGEPGNRGGDQTTSSLRSLMARMISGNAGACPVRRFLNLFNEHLEQMIDYNRSIRSSHRKRCLGAYATSFRSVRQEERIPWSPIRRIPMMAGWSPLTGAMMSWHRTVATIRGSGVHRFPPAFEQARREFGEIPDRIGDGAVIIWYKNHRPLFPDIWECMNFRRLFCEFIA